MANASVLIVEDERITAEYLRDILENANYRVLDICDKGADAIKKAIHLKPDIIFMDIMLKDNISGSEAALKISSMIDTKIIFLTAYSDNEMLEYAIDSGAVNYLIKPFKEQQILAALKVAISKSLYTSETTEVELKGGFVCDLSESKIFRNSNHIPLKSNKQKIIDCLCKHLDSAVPYKQLINCVYDKEVNTSALRTLVSRINKALDYNLIENISGVGYKISSKKG